MKRILFIFVILLAGLVGQGQVNIGIEIYCDGSSVSDGMALKNSDVSWSMRDLTKNPNCAITTHDFVYIGFYDVNTYIMIIDLDWFRRACGFDWGKDDDIEIAMTITNPSHPLYGYSGVFIFKAPNRDTDFFGNTGINLTAPAKLGMKVAEDSFIPLGGSTSGNVLTAAVIDENDHKGFRKLKGQRFFVSFVENKKFSYIE